MEVPKIDPTIALVVAGALVALYVAKRAADGVGSAVKNVASSAEKVASTTYNYFAGNADTGVPALDDGRDLLNGSYDPVGDLIGWHAADYFGTRNTSAKGAWDKAASDPGLQKAILPARTGIDPAGSFSETARPGAYLDHLDPSYQPKDFFSTNYGL